MIVGKIYFLLVRIKIKHMEIQIIKRETTGSGGSCCHNGLIQYDLCGVPSIAYGGHNGSLFQVPIHSMRMKQLPSMKSWMVPLCEVSCPQIAYSLLYSLSYAIKLLKVNTDG